LDTHIIITVHGSLLLMVRLKVDVMLQMLLLLLLQLLLHFLTDAPAAFARPLCLLVGRTRAAAGRVAVCRLQRLLLLRLRWRLWRRRRRRSA